MLIYQLYKLYYLLLIKSNEVIPTIDFTLPDYHSKFVNIIQNIGYFVPLSDITTLITILISYQLVRFALAFRRLVRH